MPKQPAQKDPETLGTDLCIEGIRTEEDIVLLWTRHVLECCNHNMTVAARVLGISRRSLYRRTAKFKKEDEPCFSP